MKLNVPYLTNLSYNKFYFDEIYDTLIRKPLDILSGFFYRIFDNKIVDGIVNGLGWGTSEASKGLRLVQSGNVGFYIFMMVVGIISLLLYTYLSIKIVQEKIMEQLLLLLIFLPLVGALAAALSGNAAKHVALASSIVSLAFAL